MLRTRRGNANATRCRTIKRPSRPERTSIPVSERGLRSQPVRANVGRARRLRWVSGEHFAGGVLCATLSAWRHGEVACPGCGLPVDAQHDIVEERRTVTSTEPIGALVTHRRCGTPFRIEFDTPASWEGAVGPRRSRCREWIRGRVRGLAQYATRNGAPFVSVGGIGSLQVYGFRSALAFRSRSGDDPVSPRGLPTGREIRSTEAVPGRHQRRSAMASKTGPPRRNGVS